MFWTTFDLVCLLMGFALALTLIALRKYAGLVAAVVVVAGYAWQSIKHIHGNSDSFILSLLLLLPLGLVVRFVERALHGASDV